jgi:hypothetical protein
MTRGRIALHDEEALGRHRVAVNATGRLPMTTPKRGFESRFGKADQFHRAAA